MQPKDIQTIEELFARNFTIYGHEMITRIMKAYTVENKLSKRFFFVDV
jgi:hypothetical protein